MYRQLRCLFAELLLPVICYVRYFSNPFRIDFISVGWEFLILEEQGEGAFPPTLASLITPKLRDVAFRGRLEIPDLLLFEFYL